MPLFKMRELAKKMFEDSEDHGHKSDILLLDALGQFADIDKVVEGVHEQYSHLAVWNIESANKKSKEIEDSIFGWLVKKINKHKEVSLLLSKGRELILPLRKYYNDFESPTLVPVKIFNEAMLGYNEALRRCLIK
jgi:hypothetical protein